MARPADRTRELERRWELASGQERWQLQLRLARELQETDSERTLHLIREVVESASDGTPFQLEATLHLISTLIRRGKLDEASRLMASLPAFREGTHSPEIPT